jgi:hypothetical protein
VLFTIRRTKPARTEDGDFRSAAGQNRLAEFSSALRTWRRNARSHPALGSRVAALGFGEADGLNTRLAKKWRWIAPCSTQARQGMVAEQAENRRVFR